MNCKFFKYYFRFRNKILSDFKDDFEETFGEKDTEWLLSILHREMMVDSSEEMLKKDEYLGKQTLSTIT